VCSARRSSPGCVRTLHFACSYAERRPLWLAQSVRLAYPERASFPADRLGAKLVAGCRRCAHPGLRGRPREIASRVSLVSSTYAARMCAWICPRVSTGLINNSVVHAKRRGCCGPGVPALLGSDHNGFCFVRVTPRRARHHDGEGRLSRAVTYAPIDHASMRAPLRMLIARELPCAHVPIGEAAAWEHGRRSARPWSTARGSHGATC
jgi:hypothetical protein